MQQDYLDGGKEHHLRRIVATLKPAAQRGFGDAQMAGELRHAAEDAAGSVQGTRIRRFPRRRRRGAVDLGSGGAHVPSCDAPRARSSRDAARALVEFRGTATSTKAGGDGACCARYFARRARKSSNSSTATGFVKWCAKPAAALRAKSSGAP